MGFRNVYVLCRNCKLCDKCAKADNVGLTPRELDLILSIARGLTNKQAGAELGIAENTVKRHLNHIFDKLGCDTRTAMVMAAIDRGIVNL